MEDLLAKMAAFLRYFAPELFQAWEKTNPRWWKVVQEHINQRLERDEADTENEEEDGIPDFAEGFNPEEHQMDKLLSDVQGDMNLLTDFLSKIYRRFYVKESEGKQEDPTKDEKLQKLVNLLTEEELVKDQKAIIFTEFRDTARYLYRQLSAAGLKNVEQVDSGRNVRNREDVIKRFAPYYNCFDSDKNLISETEISKCLEVVPLVVGIHAVGNGFTV